MKTAEIRQRFLDYFIQNGHQRHVSSPLVPADDPSLLFTNAGMVPFKSIFLGKTPAHSKRVTSIQRCLRAGGKHNDLDNVGYTARHHTFFEMLGNFSFGDYFKQEAIAFAWQFLTEILKLPAERLWVTVYHDDCEAEQIWLETIGIDADRLRRCGDADNFWSMGETGPCGPCTEIFYDHGPGVAGGPPGSNDADGDRFIEIWNIVFMQFVRQADGSMQPLPQPSVDTGMGLERIAAVMQGVKSNYEIDDFKVILRSIAGLTDSNLTCSPSMCVIADHIRACVFLITDGVHVSNEGRGYVLRRIIRRAVRHGHQLGINELFMSKLVASVVATLGDAYPEIVTAQHIVEQQLEEEEAQFNQTLQVGMKLLKSEIAQCNESCVSGELVFKLYDTYGFPVDLTADILREHGMQFDQQAFDAAMLSQREQSQAASRFGQSDTSIPVEGETQFVGYEHLMARSTIKALFKHTEPVLTLSEGESGLVVLESSPFYAESGGQQGDRGVLKASGCVFHVVDTTKQAGCHLHYGEVKAGRLTIGQIVEASVDENIRQATRLNHSATHLMHAALQHVLGAHVVQKGSLVTEQRLRFDFSHNKPVTWHERQAIEMTVNAQIRANTPVITACMPMHEAKKRGAMALFGEKYGETVRVLSMGENNFSIELCGGTHVTRTGDIGLFKIVHETAVASGVRRIEAVTGAEAIQFCVSHEDLLITLSNKLNASVDDLVKRVDQLMVQQKTTAKEVMRLQAIITRQRSDALIAQSEQFSGVNLVIMRQDGATTKTLREIVDQLRNKLDDAVICLASTENDKVIISAGVTKSLQSHVHAGELVNLAAGMVGGKGGGRADMAQGGGHNVNALEQALAAALQWVKARLVVANQS